MLQRQHLRNLLRQLDLQFQVKLRDTGPQFTNVLRDELTLMQSAITGLIHHLCLTKPLRWDFGGA